MSIQHQMTTYIDVYSFTETADTSAGFVRTFTWLANVPVFWGWDESKVDEEHHQERLCREALLLTNDATTYGYFVEKLSIAYYNSVPYLCESKEDVGNKGRALHIHVKELISDDVIPSPP